MNIQVLASTMNQNDFSLLDKMNIQSDAIIVNQSDYSKVEEFKYKNHNIKFMSFSERGVGLSRNNALMRANADICLMADDDMVYRDSYTKVILEEFKKNPKADIILFNVPIHKANGDTVIKVKNNKRVRFLNCLKYGTVNIAFKRTSILKNNISFSLLFGGGAKYGSGEDSLFITNALKQKLKIYTSTKIIAEINETASTWFEGYNEKYFFDRGALFAAMTGRFSSYVMILQFLIRKRTIYKDQISFVNAFKQMIKGSIEFTDY